MVERSELKNPERLMLAILEALFKKPDELEESKDGQRFKDDMVIVDWHKESIKCQFCFETPRQAL
jgi:hypothetical protein